MLKRLLIAAAVVALGAGIAHAQSVFPTPAPNVNAPGSVDMCASASGVYVACTGPGALPHPVTIVGQPNVTVSQPAGVNVVAAVGTGTTGAVTATLTAIPGTTLYLCGFDLSALGGTATVGPITITGLKGGTFTYQIAATAAGNFIYHPFTPCLPAASSTTNIVILTTADGTASAVDVNMWGVAQ